MEQDTRHGAPVVYWFNPSCEEEVARGRPGHQPGRLPRLLARDLGSLPLFLAEAQDVVLVREMPSRAFVDALRGAGITVPVLVAHGAAGLRGDEAGGRGLRDLRPWGWSPDSAAFLQPLAASAPPGSLRWHPGIRCLYSKAWSAHLLRTFLRDHAAPWLCDASTVGAECGTCAEVGARLERVCGQGYAQAVVKAAFGQSGRNQMQVAGGRLQVAQSRWLERILAEQGSVVVEPWLDRACDLSFHMDIVSPGRAALRGWTLFVADARGRYRGSWVSGGPESLAPEVRALVDEARLRPLAEELASHIAVAAAESGYVGPLGVDALVCRHGGVRLKPIVEVNPRYTMGRVALALQPLVAGGRAALWTVLSQRQAQQSGLASVADLVARLVAQNPLEREAHTGRLYTGVLPTTDPSSARAFASVLVVGQGAADCARLVHVPLS